MTFRSDTHKSEFLDVNFLNMRNTTFRSRCLVFHQVNMCQCHCLIGIFINLVLTILLNYLWWLWLWITSPNSVHFSDGHCRPDITFRTVFWSMLGRGEHTSVELGDFNNYFTQNVGYWIFGAYNVAIVIVLLNMLIAMMTRSFEIIQVCIICETSSIRST